MNWHLCFRVLEYKSEKIEARRNIYTLYPTNHIQMEFISTSIEDTHTHLDHLIDLTERLISLRQQLEQDPHRRSICVKLYEGSCDPDINFGMLTINHAEGTTLLTIPPDSESMRNIVNHVFRDWGHLESFLGEQNGWIFRH